MAPRTVSPTLVGRRAELDRLNAALVRAEAGEPAMVVLTGEAGVGKTRLLSEWFLHARQSDALVLVGGCVALGDGDVPYAPFTEAFRRLAAEVGPEPLRTAAGPERRGLGRLIPALASDADGDTVEPTRWDDPDARARMFELVLALLAGLSLVRPVVLVIEDLHWADPSSRELLAFLARNVRDERIVLVGTYRSDELRRRHPLLPLLGMLERLPGVERIELPRLDRDEVAELLAALTGDVPGTRFVDDMLRRSDGNPFFVEELLAAGGARSSRGLPATLQNVLADRFATLSDPAQRLLGVAAVIGRRVDHDLLAELAGHSPDELVAVLREVVDQQLLVAADADPAPSYDFRHALVREVAYDQLLPAERAALHHAVALALEVRAGTGAQSTLEPGFAAELAHHWSGALDEERALAASVRAAHAVAGVFAHEEALEHLERALRLWDRVSAPDSITGSDRRTLLESAAAAAAGAGALRRAVELAREAVGPDRTGRAPTVNEDWARRADRLGWYESELGDQPRALETIEAALARLPADPPAIGRVRLLTTRGVLLWALGNYGDGVVTGPATVEAARRLGDPRTLANALLALGAARASYGRLDDAVGDLTEARTLFIESGDPMSGIATSQLGYAHTLAGRYDEAIAVCQEELERQAAIGGTRRFGPYLLSDIADCYVDLARWDEVVELCEATLSDLAEGRTAPWFHETLAEVLVPLGRLDEAERALDAANEAVGRDADVIDRIWVLRPMITLARARGRVDEVRAAIDEALSISRDPVHDAPLWGLLDHALGAEADAAEAAAARRDEVTLATARERGGHLADLLEEAARSAGRVGAVPAPLGAIAARAAAERSRLDGRADPEAWAAAVAAYDALDSPYEAAVCRAHEAEALLVAGAPRDRAAEPLRAAFDAARRIGATLLLAQLTGLAQRARIELPASPGDDASAPPVAAAIDDAAALGLTAREREVLRLLARGRSNREIGETLFISEKTASVHVSNILGKLGVSGRGAAAAIAVRLGYDDPEVAPSTTTS